MGDRIPKAPSILRSGANFLVVESRPRGNHIWGGGRVTYRLRLVDGQMRLAYKKVQLVDADQPVPSLSFLI